MRKKRIPSSGRKTSSSSGSFSSPAGRRARARELKAQASLAPSPGRPRRFLGLSLSGGKADKSCIAVLECFSAGQKKMFLSKLIDKIKAEEFISADLKIHEILGQYQSEAEALAIDVPLQLPVCLTCALPCPGYEACGEPEIRYIHHLYHQNEDKKKPRKLFTPYTQRCVDAYLAHYYGEQEPHHAMGANLAPLTARARFISRRLGLPSVEVFPRLSVWTLGNSLKINKSTLRVYRNSIGGEDAREILIRAFADQLGVFFYEQDRRMLIENNHAFEAFICAFTAMLQADGRVEKRPRDLPKSQSWLAIPQL